jgi:hypothetical protein
MLLARGPRGVRGLAAPALVAVLAAGALGGCTGDDPESETSATAPSTPLASYATDDVTINRAPFCEEISNPAAEEALGGPVASSETYENGDRAKLTDGVRDVAHEYDCTYTAADRSTARAWLFAPPVDDERARELVSEARRTEGCRPQPDAPAFGAVSIALLCDDDTDATASFRGLFGDSWLSCSLEIPSGSLDDEELLDRTGRWCVQVAEAAAV